MIYRLARIGLTTAFFVMGMAGCDRSGTPENATSKPADQARSAERRSPRIPPEFKTDPTGKTIPMAEMLAAARQKSAGMPAGHPPISTQPGEMDGATTLPAGHPPIGSMPAGHPSVGQGNQALDDSAPPEKMLDLNLPPAWTKKAPRPMTVAVYELPKTEGNDPAELTISHYPGMKNIPLDMQVQRWAGQFQQADGKSAQEAVKQSKLDGAAHPTSLVDITGRYTASSMMNPAKGPARDNYEMLVGYMETEEGPWFFKLIGPQAAVAAHRDEFLKVLREAK